jgi:hypothetical protein
MRYKTVVCAIIIATLAYFPGCNKKGNQAGGMKSSGIPEMSKKASMDTADIFKEFYSDDTAGQGGSKKSSAKSASKSQTFSPSSAAASSPGEFKENGRYVVQVSCVQAKSFAEKVITTFKEKNFPAYIAEVQNPTPALTGTFYRIRIGGFGGYSSAKMFGDNTLVPGGFEYWIDKKSNDNTGMEGYGLGSGASATTPAANNATTPSSSWSSPAPSASPTIEPPSSNSPYSGTSDYNAPPSAAEPPPNSQAITSPGSNAPSKSQPANSPSPLPPSPETKTATPPSPGNTSSGASKAPASESGDWGTDTSASSSSGGW